MQNLLLLLGRAAGAIGILVCTIAVLTRLAGTYQVAGLWVGTLLQAGTAALVAGCFLLLVSKPSGN